MLTFLMMINNQEDNENQVEEYVISWKSYFYPEHIPNGYRLSNSQSFGKLKVIYFSNDKGGFIEFSQSPVNPSFQVDTENARTEEIYKKNGIQYIVNSGDHIDASLCQKQ